MQVNFTAKGDFKQLTSALRAVNSQVNQSMRGVRTSAIKTVHPLEQINEATRKGNLTWRQYRDSQKMATQAIRRHNGLLSAQASITKDVFGNAKVYVNQMGEGINKTVSMGDRLRWANTHLRGFSQQLVKTGKNMQWAGRQVTVGLTVPLGFAAKRAMDAAEAFDEMVTRTIKVYNFAFGGMNFEIDNLRANLERFATDVAQSLGYVAEETLGLVAEFAQMGNTGQALLTLSEQALNIARLGSVDLAQATELVRSVTSAYGVTLEDLNGTLARFNLIENETALGIAELAEALPIVANAAKTVGLNVENTAAILAVAKENGINTKEAATALRTSLVRLVDPTKKANDAFSELGINIDELRDSYGDDFMGFLSDLSTQLTDLQKSGQASGQDILRTVSAAVGVRQASRFIAMLNGISDAAKGLDKNSAGVRAFTAANMDMEEAMIAAQQELERWRESAAGTAEILKAELSVELSKLGKPILEVANKVRRMAVDFLKWFNSLSDGAKRATLTFAGLVAAIGPVGMLLGIMANAFGTVMNVISRLFPSMVELTAQEHAQSIAFRQGALAIDQETAAVARNMAMKQRAVTKNAAYTASQMMPAPNPAARAGMPGGAKGGMSAGSGIGAAMGSAIPTKGRFAAGLAKMFFSTPVGLITAGLAIAAIAAGALAVSQNFGDFLSKVKEAVEGPIERLKMSFGRVKDIFDRLMSSMRTNGEQWKGIAETIGSVLGKALGIVIDAIGFIIELVGGRLATLISNIVRFVGAIASLLRGDVAGAWELVTEIISEQIMSIVRLGGSVLRMLANIADAVGMDQMAAKARNLSNELERSAAASLGIKEYWEGGAETLEKIKDTQDDITSKEKQAQQILEQAVKDNLVKKSALDDISNLSAYEVKQNENLTDEMKEQLLWLIKIQSLKNDLEAIEKRIISVQDRATDGAMTRNQAEGAIRLLEEERLLITNKIENLTLSIASGLRDQADAAAELAEKQEDASESAREYMNTLRQVSGEFMGEIVDAVMEAVKAEGEALKESFERREQALEDYFDKKEDRIDQTADEELKRIEEIEKEEARLDALREEFFQREKMRIEFMERKAVGNIELRVALAEGELDQAAIIRERLFRQDEEFLQDQMKLSLEAEADKRKGVLEEKKDEVKEWRDAEKEKLQIQEDSAKRRLEVERDAAEKAHDRRAEMIKRDLEVWKEVTPATEAEYEAHLGRLAGMLNNKYGITFKSIMDNFKAQTGSSLVSGFATIRDKVLEVLAEEKKWQDAIGRAVEAAMETAAQKAKEGVEKLGQVMGVGFNIDYSNLNAQVIRAIQSSMGPAGSPGSGKVHWNHSGGSVPGPVMNRSSLKSDEVPTVLQTGEYVVKRSAVQKYGVDYLEALNAQKFHDGGLIPNMAGQMVGNMATLGFALGLMGGSVGGAAGPSPGSYSSSYGRSTPGQIAPNTAAAQRFIKGSWDLPHGVAASLGRRDPKSDHGKGKALDVMVSRLGRYANAEEGSIGTAISNWFIRNADAFGTKYVIWNGKIANGRIGNWKWRDYWGANMGPTQGHYDHVHLSFLHSGGLVGDAPKFRWGGKLKQDSLINAHKGEYVVRQPLAAQFEKMMDGGGQGGDVNLHFHNIPANIDEERLANIVMRKVEHAKAKKSRGRTLRSVH